MTETRREMSRPVTLWVPGQGPDFVALQRMEQAFTKPKRPMGEAWFMALERRMYAQLLDDLDTVDDGEIEKALEQTATGPGSFGQREEWTEWFHYLLPRLVTRDWHTGLHSSMEVLFTAFMAQHPWVESPWPYQRFRTDALATLGRFVMAPRFWPDGELDVVACLDKRETPSGLFGWYKTSGLLSASLFFCAKYLPPGDVPGWFRSVLAIPDRRWTAQVITWLVGAHAILTDESGWPDDLPRADSFGVDWSWSHALHGWPPGGIAPSSDRMPFLPAENRASILQATQLFDAIAFFEDFLTDPALEIIAAESAGLTERFYTLYG